MIEEIIEQVFNFLYSGYLIPITVVLLIIYFKFRNKINLFKSKFLTDFSVIAVFVFSIDIMIFPHRYAFLEKSSMYFKNGESVINYEDGSYEKRNYVNGKLQGTAQFFTKDGIIEDFKYDNGFKNGESIVRYKNGGYEKRNYVNGKLQGLAQLITKDGFLMEDFKYVDDVIVGESTFYYLIGTYEKRNYINGNLQGIAQIFTKEGSKIAEFNYVDGIRSGEAVEYYKNGSVAHFTYENGIPKNISVTLLNGTKVTADKVIGNILFGQVKSFDKDNNKIFDKTINEDGDFESYNILGNRVSGNIRNKKIK